MPNLTDIVDSQMSQPKTAIIGNKGEDSRKYVNGDLRITSPIFDEKGNSLQIPMELHIICRSNPDIDQIQACILARTGLSRGDLHTVSRLDFGKYERHRFRPDKHPHTPPGWDWSKYPDLELRGSHIHAWDLNRHLGDEKRLPVNLPFAIPLGEKSWQEAFQIFCARSNLIVDNTPECAKELLL